MLQYGGVEVDETNAVQISEDPKFFDFYKKLKDEPNLIRFFYRKPQSAYTVHGQNAILLATELFKSARFLQYWSKESSEPPSKKSKQVKTPVKKSKSSSEYDQFPYIGIREGMDFGNALSFILYERQWRCEIWEGSQGDWDMVRKASPGNMESVEELMQKTDGNYATVVLAVKVVADKDTSRRVGVCFIDVVMRTIKVREFPDSEQLSVFQSLLVQTGAKECLFVPGADSKKLEEIIERCKITVNHRIAKDFKKDNIEQDLTRLVGETKITQSLTLLEQKAAMEAASCLINYLELTGDDSNHGHYELSEFNFDQYMKLDAAAVEALSLIPQKANEGYNKNTNLFGFLNRCKTPMGKRRLMQWIRLPLLDIKEIEKRTNFIEIFMEDSSLRNEVIRLLNLQPDFDKLIKKIVTERATLEDCFSIFTFTKSLENFHNAFNNYTGKKHLKLVSEFFLNKVNAMNEYYEHIQKMIETTIDIEAANNHEFIIKHDFDPELGEIKQDKKKIFKAIESHMEKLVDELGLKDKELRMDYKRHIGWYYEIGGNKAANQKKITGDAEKFHIVEGHRKKSGPLPFRDKFITKQSEKYQLKIERWEKIQSTHVQALLGKLGEAVPALERSSNFFAELDTLQSLAQVFSNPRFPYVRPKLLPPGQKIHLVKARHPCLEVQEDVQFQSNNVELVHDKSRFILVTGPNMGGKSTYIRQVGVITLLAQMGGYVPCESASISIVDSILARVGANDSQLRGVSTFMAEMLEMASIVKSATVNSLLIIDELGRGTSTFDGFGLAWAISEFLYEKGSFCLFATHFHELTELDTQKSGVVNLHVDAKVHDGELQLLHHVMPGPATRSYGIEVAELAGFPKHLIDVARAKAKELEKFDTEMRAKKKSSEEAEAEEIIRSFMSDFKNMPMGTVQNKQAAVLALKKKYLGKTKNEIVHKYLNGEQ